jgi:hypothetical protein
VHTALIICDTAEVELLYHVYYTSSSDHGVSWFDLGLVDEDTNLGSAYPDIGADSAGHAYVVWSHGEAGQFRIWFATNNPAAIAERPVQPPIGAQPWATVVQGMLFLPGAENGDSPSERQRQTRRGVVPILLDISGRKVMDLRPGVNDVRGLAPGVYFIRTAQAQAQAQAQAIRKVVVTK